MDFLDDAPGDAPAVVARIPGLIAERASAFGTFLNAFSRFLLAPDRVMAGLVAIEERMWTKAQEQRKPGSTLTRDSLLAALADRSADRGELRMAADHLLSTVLTEIEIAHGFDMAEPRRRAVTLSDLVKNEMFRDDLIGKGYTWKDPGVNPTHGEFTHRLQWCAAMLAMGGATAWEECFIRIGAWTDVAVFDGKVFGLWDALVDRNVFVPGGPPVMGATPYDSRSASDFRSPENLHAWLLEPDQRAATSDIRLLATFINNRNNKRVAEEATGVEYLSADKPWVPTVPLRPLGTFRQTTWDKWSRTLFNRPVASLAPTDKATLARAWHRLTMMQDGERRYPIVVLAAGDAIHPPAPGADLVEAYTSLGLRPTGEPL